MSKTVDELRKAYKDGYRTKVDSYDYHPSPSSIVEAERAGIAAVIRALRDEILPPKKKVSASSTIVRAIILQKFNEILGAAGDEAGTHGSPELDEDARKLEAMGQDSGMTLEQLLEPAALRAAAGGK